MKECKRLSLDKSPESWSVWNSSLIFKQLLVEKITQRLTKIPKPVAFGSAMQDYLVLEPADKQEMFPKNKLRQRPVIWMSEIEKITCSDIHGDLPAIKTSGFMIYDGNIHFTSLCVGVDFGTGPGRDSVMESPGGSEHAAWDCSSVPSRVAHLVRHWMKHLEGDSKAWWFWWSLTLDTMTYIAILYL